jgi:hypothetical protein
MALGGGGGGKNFSPEPEPALGGSNFRLRAFSMKVCKEAVLPQGRSCEPVACKEYHLPYAVVSIQALTFQSLAITLRTTGFNIKKFYVVPTLRLCVLYGSHNKQRLLPYKTLRDWFL